MSSNQEPSMPVLIQDLGMLLPSELSNRKAHYGLYKCQCGVEFKAQFGNINRKITVSCGCHRVSKATTHGYFYHRLFNIWRNMLKRTENPNATAYSYYGGRGISVCERWHDMTNFIEDMYPTFKEGLSLDRIDNNGNYEPSNCRWETKENQSRHTRLIHSTNKSGYRGASFDNTHSMWASSIKLSGKRKHLGYFTTAIEAAKAYDNYIKEHSLSHTSNGLV